MRDPFSPTDLFHALGAAVLLVVALTYGQPYLAPIAVAVLIWFLINAIADGICRAVPWAPGWAATVAALAILFGVVTSVVSVIAGNLAALGSGLDGAEAKLSDALASLLGPLGLAGRVDLEVILSSVRIEELARVGLSTARSLASDIGLVFLYAMFLLVDQRFYTAKLAALVPDEERRLWLRGTLFHVAEEVRAYLWLMTLISAGVGLATWGICAAFGLARAGFWGFLAFALNFIPTLGSIAGVAIPSAYALLQTDADAELLLLIASLSAVQLTAGEVVLPRLMGDRLNLSSFVILLSLVVWGAMWGPAGMFLAIPIMVIVTITMAQFPRTRPIAILLSKAGDVTPRERA